MNKIKLLTATTIFALFAGAIVLHSCSKQETQNPLQAESLLKDYTIYNRLSSFRGKMDFYKDNPIYKSTESVDVDSAIWLLEGAMNLTYGFPYKEYTDYEKGTAIINLEKDNEGEINYNELAVKYQQVIDEAREDYYSSGFVEKSLYLVNLEITEETETEVTFTVETITGNLGENNASSPIFDNWWYGDDEGGCEGNNAGESDAAHKLAEAYPTYDMPENMSILEPTEVTLIGGEPWLRRPGDELNNQYDYYIFSVSEEVDPFDYDDNCCLQSEKMGQYYNDLDYVIQILAPAENNLPDVFEFLEFTAYGGEKVEIGDTDTYEYRHFFKYLAGIPYERPITDPAISL